ncbi:xyloglucan-specific endo-beta-1,4-glucanase A [Ilyonectria robusta]|uniref:xyloglucan-specific endo-beta-1,4-glucanase A n=1 Tax=Ilyonectria robusta TaxID=1079257 RepID=UPI001E8CD432|nr:xyloglucan-specific endo-beta-1,4-glucanase A [Ilyonectria robusta]KAH8666215.1 xyloglucan-specific endo-beta-1,4-glucanase A [Ilyonectria robusta]
MKFSCLASALFATLAAASPTPTSLEKRATTWCDSFGSLATGGLTIYHNNWGAAQATSGSQCTTFESITSGSVVWSTSWTWAGGSSSVKSYSNVALENVNKKLSAISSIPSKWTWTQTGSNVVADVAYDLWLAPSVGANNQYEIMIWLAAYGGAGPISSTGSAIATVTIAGSSWKLYSGPNGDTTVYSFVASSTITSFNGDLNLFFKYLTSSQGVSTSMVATSLQAGTEPFTGSNVVFKTSAYTISVA